jgi:hypothetical protein
VNKKNNINFAIGGPAVFKLFLVVGIVLISVVFIWYTLDVINQLKSGAEKTVASYVKLWQKAANDTTSAAETQFIFDEVISKANFPVVIADLDRQPLFWRNIHGIVDNDPSPQAHVKIKKIVDEMSRDYGEIPLMYGDRVISYFYYGDSPVISQLKRMPFIEIGLVLSFILIGFIGFQNIRRSEERHIWVGMAKETAHQLGTPISSLLGWIEILMTQCEAGKIQDPSQEMNRQEIFEQMKTDVTRLQRVANRFGQIGSKPELREFELNNLLADTGDYFRKRLPFEGKGIQITCNLSPLPALAMNGELVGWAVENLVKNALQAVNSQTGRIELISYPSKDQKSVIIQVQDNGSGISPRTARKLFRPGFTTKKRGWGLGLTLARRIVQEYHGGKIFLVRSRPGETVFQITLPVNKATRTRKESFGVEQTD